MSTEDDRSNLGFVERLFLRTYCYPPPGRSIPPGHAHGGAVRNDPLGTLHKWYGEKFDAYIKDKVVLDLGCGTGEQAVGCALSGAAHVIAADIRPVYVDSQCWAAEIGCDRKIEFTTAPLAEMAEGTIDVAYSLNAFEHFSDPAKILADVRRVLKPDGRFLITFGPPWLAPYGVHMYFMIKYPWAHVLFSEATILRVRQLYRNDNARYYEEVEGGLNRMTIRRFKEHILRSGFYFERLDMTPVKGMTYLTKIPLLREYFTTHVTAILAKCQ